MLPTVMLALLLCTQGGTPQTQKLKAVKPVVFSQSLIFCSNLFYPAKPKIALDKKIINTAEKQIGIRYVWGGTSRGGFDCSGFVRYVFSKHNFKLPRTAAEQSRVGKNVSRLKWIPGDLIFFGSRNSRVSHVGIYKGNNKFIHASSGGGRIRIDEIAGYYATRYVGARRILSTAADNHPKSATNSKLALTNQFFLKKENAL